MRLTIDFIQIWNDSACAEEPNVFTWIFSVDEALTIKKQLEEFIEQNSKIRA